MKNNSFKFALSLIASIFLTLGLSLSFQSVIAAWTAPSDLPPASNLNPVLYDYDSDNDEIKIGDASNVSVSTNHNLIVGGSFSVDGKVGIGTNNPSEKLSVYGALNPSAVSPNTMPGVMSLEAYRQDLTHVEVGAINGKNSGHEVNRISLYRGQQAWSGYFGFWTKKDNDSVLTETVRIDNEGKVGIGTLNPVANLDVVGSVKASKNIETSGYVVTGNTGEIKAGAIKYDAVLKSFFGYDGSSWKQFDNTSCVVNFGTPCGGTSCIEAGIIDCSGTCVGTTNKTSGTSCGLNMQCDGSGNCVSTCVANFGQACGGTACVNAGTYDCSGTCVGTTYKTSGTICDTNKECDGSGSCVAVSFCSIPSNLGGLCDSSGKNVCKSNGSCALAVCGDPQGGYMKIGNGFNSKFISYLDYYGFGLPATPTGANVAYCGTFCSSMINTGNYTYVSYNINPPVELLASYEIYANSTANCVCYRLIDSGVPLLKDTTGLGRWSALCQ